VAASDEYTSAAVKAVCAAPPPSRRSQSSCARDTRASCSRNAAKERNA
jgi:hypothetical protein